MEIFIIVLYSTLFALPLLSIYILYKSYRTGETKHLPSASALAFFGCLMWTFPAYYYVLVGKIQHWWFFIPFVCGTIIGGWIGWRHNKHSAIANCLLFLFLCFFVPPCITNSGRGDKYHPINYARRQFPKEVSFFSTLERVDEKIAAQAIPYLNSSLEHPKRYIQLGALLWIIEYGSMLRPYSKLLVPNLARKKEDQDWLIKWKVEEALKIIAPQDKSIK